MHIAFCDTFSFISSQLIILCYECIRNGSLTQFKDEDFNSIYIQITNKSAAQWNDTCLNPVSNYEVAKSNGNFTIRDVQNKSNSGVLYKCVVVFSHSMNCTTMASISINNFQFVTILMQDITIVENFSVGLSNEIENKFIILMGIIIGSSLLLCLIIGGCVFWSTRKITSPIQKLIELTSTIKKKHKIEEIRNKVKNHELFKKFQNEEASKKDNNTEENQDEIQELITIFYNFLLKIIEDQKSNVLKMSSYEYPRNLYYEPSEHVANDMSHLDEINISEEKEESYQENSKNVPTNRFTTFINDYGINGSDDESDQLLKDIDSEEDEKVNENAEGDLQQKIKPPILINWENIILEHMNDSAKD